MFTAIAIAQASTRRTNIYNTLAFSAIALVTVNPRIIYEVGFQLSYLAVVGIIFLQPKIYGWINSKNWLIDKAWQISSVSIAAQIATFPLSLYYFHMFPSYFLISNLIVIPLTGVVLSLGLIYFAFWWVPLIQDLIGHILSWSVDFLSTLVCWVGSLAGSQIEIVDLRVLPMFLLYGAIIAFIGYCVRQHLTWLKIAFSCVIVMVSIAALTDEIRSEQRLITIYEVRGEDVIGIKRGYECWLITETSLVPKDLSYMIEPDLIASGISKVHQITLDKHFQIVRKDMLLSQEAIKLGKLELKGPGSLRHLVRIVADANLSSWD
jgi:competence protein ComEC